MLRRRNRLKTFVSERIAKAIDQWEVYDESELFRDRPPVEVRVPELLDHIVSNEVFYETLESSLSKQPRCDVDYEKLFVRREQERVLRFLGVVPDHLRLEARSVKQNPDDQLVANFDELSAALAGTEFENELRSN